jgi:hypothetical protein
VNGLLLLLLFLLDWGVIGRRGCTTSNVVVCLGIPADDGRCWPADEGLNTGALEADVGRLP